MSDNFDPNAIYKDSIHDSQSLDSPSARATLASAGFEGLDFSKPIATKHISNEEIKEIAEQCSVPNDSLSPEQRNAIMEYQIRMGVGQARSRGRTSNKTYHYFR